MGRSLDTYFAGSRQPTAEEILRRRRLGWLFEDIIGAKDNFVRVPNGSEEGKTITLESSLNLLKRGGRIEDFLDLRDRSEQVEDYKRFDNHFKSKPDFLITLIGGSIAQAEAKNYAKRAKDHPDIRYPPYFTRTNWQAREDIRLDWLSSAKSVLIVSFDIYTGAARVELEQALDALIFANEGGSVSEDSNLTGVRDFVAFELYQLFKRWRAEKETK